MVKKNPECLSTADHLSVVLDILRRKTTGGRRFVPYATSSSSPFVSNLLEQYRALFPYDSAHFW